LASPCAQEVDQLGARIKRVRDDGSACERERGSELPVDLDKQDRLRERCGAVKLGQPRERPVITLRPESKRHAPFGRNAAPWLSSVVR
jgi:hypothetical protein